MEDDRPQHSGKNRARPEAAQEDGPKGVAHFREAQQRQHAEDREYRRQRDLKKEEAEQQRAERRQKIEHERFDISQNQAARASALIAAASAGSGDEDKLLAMAERFAKWILEDKAK